MYQTRHRALSAVSRGRGGAKIGLGRRIAEESVIEGEGQKKGSRMVASSWEYFGKGHDRVRREAFGWGSAHTIQLRHIPGSVPFFEGSCRLCGRIPRPQRRMELDGVILPQTRLSARRVACGGDTSYRIGLTFRLALTRAAGWRDGMPVSCALCWVSSSCLASKLRARRSGSPGSTRTG